MESNGIDERELLELLGRDEAVLEEFVGLNNDLYEALEKGSADVADLSVLMERFNRGDFALVGVGRAMLSNPDFARKVRGGIKIAAFDKQYIHSLV